jgi:hypothetical protein
MNRVSKILRVAYRVFVTILFVVAVAIVATSFSAIYDFASPAPFSGDDIFNPYSEFDPNITWKRTSLHTHTRVEGPLNECEFTATETVEKYHDFGYDIVGISNHNEITPHPDSAQDIGIYEHGYNLRNFHKLVIGAEAVNRFDALYPISASQAQYQLDILRQECKILQLNHPSRSALLDSARLTKICGYDIMELSGVNAYLENKHWDWALSAGRYSFALLNDDLHYPDRSSRFAVRCSFLGAKEVTIDDIVTTLNNGCFYSVRVPDYGNGNWEVKETKNKTLPTIENIGLQGDTIYLKLSHTPQQIRVIGEGHSLLKRVTASDSIAYVMRKCDPYARIVASYPDSLIIMTNAFARYDKETMASPADRDLHTIDTRATVLYNIAVAAVLIIILTLYITILRRWRTK